MSYMNYFFDTVCDAIDDGFFNSDLIDEEELNEIIAFEFMEEEEDGGTE